jgi:phosphate transport system protein
VPAVLTQVHGDAVGPAQMRLDRRPHRIRLVGSPRLADGGDVIDVDAEFDHGRGMIRLSKRVLCRWHRRYTANRVNTEFSRKLAQLRDDMLTQGNRVLDVTTRAVESYFERDLDKARSVVSGDSLIDKVDVAIERASIDLLRMGESDEHNIRSVLTIVKVNNELERIADIAVNIAEVSLDSGQTTEVVPATFRVMANSVIGMLRDANQSLARVDAKLAERVLAFDDTVDRFKTEISLDAQQKVASGKFGVKFAFRLMTVVKNLERIADHATNICEQLIYLETGRIVRHLPEGWSKPVMPEV